MAFYPIPELIRLVPVREPGRPFLIALDGGGGSGKSTLAREWSDADPLVRVVALDDFYIPVSDEVLITRGPEQDYKRCFDLSRIEAQVLEPLTNGKRASYQKLNWATGNLEAWQELAPQGVVLIEGVYSHRQEWSKYFGLRIWIETSKDLRRSRMAARGHNSQAQMDCWQAAEDWYIATRRPVDTADAILDGTTGLILKRY